MAGREYDDIFGDFTFTHASNSSSIQFNQKQSLSKTSFPESTIAANGGKLEEEHQDKEEEDDEWGDFVETPLRSAASSDNLSKPSDPFDVFSSNPSSQSQLQSESTSATRVVSALPGSESEKKPTQQWLKIKGAIPLSVFGNVEEEEEEEQMEGMNTGMSGLPDNNKGKDSESNVSYRNYNVGNGSKENAYSGVGMSYDAIANLYNTNRQINFGNGFGSNKNFSSPNSNNIESSRKDPISELNGLNLDLSGSALKKGDSDNRSQKVNIQDMHHLNAESHLNTIASKGYQTQLSKANSSSSQSSLNGLELDLTEKRSSNFGAWNFDFDGFKPNSNGTDLDFQVLGSNANVDSGDDDIEDGVWEFKDAHSETKFTAGNDKAQAEEHKILEANRNSKDFIDDSNKPLALFPLSSGSFDLFSMSNGTGSFHNFAAGTDSKPSLTTQNSFGSGKYLKEQTKSNSGLDSPVGNGKYQEGFGHFATAVKENGPSEEAEQSMHGSGLMVSSFSQSSNCLNGSTDFFASTRSIDLFAPLSGNTKELMQIDFNVDADPSITPNVQAAINDCGLKAHSRSEKINDQGALDSHLAVVDGEFDDDFGEFTAASAESANVAEATESRAKDHKGPLPLSIFGAEEQESEGSLDIQEAFLHQSTSYKRDNWGSNSTISINDLFSDLNSQADQISSLDFVHKPIQNGLNPSEDLLGFNEAKDTDDFDDSSWEFKDASLERGVENGSCLHNSWNVDHSPHASQLELNLYVDFYSKLIQELHFLANCHLKNLKEAQATTTSNQDEKLAPLIQEMQAVLLESRTKSAVSEEPLGDHTCKESNISALIKSLQEPQLQVLESEYSLQTKLSLVNKDSRLTIQLIKHALTMLKILSLGSPEEKITYVSIWSKMISVCVEELQYGAKLWRHAFEKNVQSEMVTYPEGKKFLLALGEIYRVAVILEASVKLYKPWILLISVESSGIYHLLDECHTLWHSSGLEEALLTLSVSTPLDGDNRASLLVESIKYLYGLDALALENNVVIQQELLCRLSLLSSNVVPGMALVDWGGEQCFVKLANLWANLISNDIPKLPSICVN